MHSAEASLKSQAFSAKTAMPQGNPLKPEAQKKSVLWKLCQVHLRSVTQTAPLAGIRFPEKLVILPLLKRWVKDM